MYNDAIREARLEQVESFKCFGCVVSESGTDYADVESKAIQSSDCDEGNSEHKRYEFGVCEITRVHIGPNLSVW